MARTRIQVTEPRFVEIDEETEEICPKCNGVGEVAEMHVFVPPTPMMTCFTCQGRGKVEKKKPEPVPVRHECNMSPGGIPCELPGVVFHEDGWFCLAHTDKLLARKLEPLFEGIREYRELRKKRQEAAKLAR